MNPSGTVPTGAMPVNNNMMPQAATTDVLCSGRGIGLCTTGIYGWQMYLVMDLPIFRKIHHPQQLPFP